MKLIEIMSQMHIFNGLNPAQLAMLEPLFALYTCEADEVIFQQGDAAEYLYIVIEGDVAIIFKPDDDEAITVANIEKDGVFGWSAAFGSGSYTSGAVSRSPSKMLRVRGEALKAFHKKHPKTGILVLDRLAKVVASRLKRTHTHNQVVAMLEHGLLNGVKPIGG